MFGPALLSDTAATVFQTPVGKSVTLRRLRVDNPTASAVPFTLSIGVDATGNRLWDATSVPAGGSLNDHGPFTLSPGTLIQAFAGSASALVLELDGVESDVTDELPLEVSPEARFIQTQAGTPYGLWTEFAWLLAGKATQAEVDDYLDDRQARGFTGVVFMAMPRPGGTYGWPSVNCNGDAAFNVGSGLTTDFSTPNDDYFDNVDLVIDKLAERGMQALVFYLYAGFGGGNEGWYEVVGESQNTELVMYNFGLYLAARWANKKNVIIMAGGDYTMPSGTTRDKMHACQEGLRAGGCQDRLGGSEWGSPDSLVTDQAGYTYGTNPLTSDLQIDSFYGQGPSSSGHTYVTALEAWDNVPTLPAFMEEPMQLYGTYAPISSTRQGIRRYIHWAVESGSIAGSNWGIFSLANEWIQDPQDPDYWQNWLDDPGSEDQTLLIEYYNALPLSRMLPTGVAAGRCGRLLITSTNPNDDTYISACVDSLGTAQTAYVPSTGTGATTFTMDLRSLAGTTNFKWRNPTTGALTNIGDFANTGTQSFTTPGDNGTGTNDWELVGLIV